MDNEYNKLRNELENADIDSILPGFDQQAAWQELSPRLKKNKSVYWLRYAAALAIILIVAFVVRMQMDSEIPTKDNVTSTIQTQLPETTLPVTKSPGIPQPVTSGTTLAMRRQKTQKEGITVVQPYINTPEVTGEIAKENKTIVEDLVTADTITASVVATQVKPVIKRPKAVHLLDIDNENRQAVIQNRNELQTLPLYFAFLIPANQYAGSESDRKPSSLFKSN